MSQSSRICALCCSNRVFQQAGDCPGCNTKSFTPGSSPTSLSSFTLSFASSSRTCSQQSKHIKYHLKTWSIKKLDTAYQVTGCKWQPHWRYQLQYLADKELLLILKLSHSLLELRDIGTNTLDVLLSSCLEHILHLPDVYWIWPFVCSSRTLLRALAWRNLTRFCWWSCTFLGSIHMRRYILSTMGWRDALSKYSWRCILIVLIP